MLPTISPFCRMPACPPGWTWQIMRARCSNEAMHEHKRINPAYSFRSVEIAQPRAVSNSVRRGSFRHAPRAHGKGVCTCRLRRYARSTTHRSCDLSSYGQIDRRGTFALSLISSSSPVCHSPHDASLFHCQFQDLLCKITSHLAGEAAP